MDNSLDSKNDFFIKNTHEVNKIIANTLLWCTSILVVLLITDMVGIFHFDKSVKYTIIIIGMLTTIGPSVLIKLNVNDDIQKYYMLISLSCLIGLLGTNNKIGIYITYVLVPIVSCLYFDRKFTVRISICSYMTMVVGVFFNSAGKLEVIYKNWSHMLAFRNYIIGFSLEYLAVFVFILQVVKRSQIYLESQIQNMVILKAEKDKQEKISALYTETISRNRKTAYEMMIGDVNNMTADCHTLLAAGYQFVAKLQESLLYSSDVVKDVYGVLIQVGEYFDLDRIMIIEGTGADDGSSTLSFQWNRNNTDEIKDYISELTQEAYIDISRRYDTDGFIELLKTENLIDEQIKDMDTAFTRYIASIMLGAQIWFPVISSGEYSGAICFDRYRVEPYSTVDRFLLSEVSRMLMAQLNRISSENANQAKTIFLSNMSHEIRTPMNAILGMTEVALRENMNDSVKKCLNIIRSSAEGLLAIINDILDFSKIESGKVDIITGEYMTLSLINDVITMVEARNSEKGLKLNYEISDDIPTTMVGDMNRIKQVMVNLATNAIKYTDEGSVTITVDVLRKEDNIGTLIYKVKDTGQGIRDEDKARLFKSFSQVNQKNNRNVEGTGLGLAISKQLIDLMGGQIGFESEFGKGSEFYFELPQEISNSSPAGKVEDYSYEKNIVIAEEEDFKAPWAKILIVDDNEINLLVTESLFEPYELQIDTAPGGLAALELVKENKYDLIFMDHFMPDLDGVETTKLIRGMEGNPNQNIPIVALTADVVLEVKNRMLSEGMNDFLPKPVDVKSALRILKKYIKKD